MLVISNTYTEPVLFTSRYDSDISRDFSFEAYLYYHSHIQVRNLIPYNHQFGRTHISALHHSPLRYKARLLYTHCSCS